MNVPYLCKAQYFYKNNNEENKMAEEKDKSTLYVGGIILLAVIGVLILKGRETEHLEQTTASTAASQAAFEAANEKRLRTQNIFVE
jgi:Ca2+/H+ antiporter